MQRFADAKLLEHCRSLFKFMVLEKKAEMAPLRPQTLLLLIRLCGRLGDRSRDVLNRHVSHSGPQRYLPGRALSR